MILSACSFGSKSLFKEEGLTNYENSYDIGYPYPADIDNDYYNLGGYPVETKDQLNQQNKTPNDDQYLLPTLTPPELQIIVPIPDEGKGSVGGILFSVSMNTVIPNTIFYLTEAIGENSSEIPPFFVGPSDDQITYNSDENGIFILDNLIPGNYYLVMSGPPYDWTVGYKDISPTPYLIKVKPDNRTNLGVIYIFWP